MTDFIVSFGIPLAYVALGIAIIAALAFPFIQMFQDLKKAKSAFFGIGALIVLFIICYVLAANEPFSIGDINISAGQMRTIEAGIYLFYFTLVGSIIAILYSTVSRYFK